MFDLDDHHPEIAARLATGKCELSGLPFNFQGSHGGWANPSIDRINSRDGYLYENVRIILQGLNAALGNWGEETLLLMVAAMRAHDRAVAATAKTKR